MRQLDVKPGRGAAMLPHQLRVGAAQRGERFVESFAESFVHSAHRPVRLPILFKAHHSARFALAPAVGAGGGGVSRSILVAVGRPMVARQQARRGARCTP